MRILNLVTNLPPPPALLAKGDIRDPFLFSNLLSVRNLIAQVDQDGDSCLNIDEFISIFRKVASEKLDETSALLQFVRMTEIDVSQSGVKGARDFFEVKIKESGDSGLSRIMEEERIRKQNEEEERKRRQAEMVRKISAFEETS